MSNTITTIQKQEFTPEQLTLITNTIAKGATKDELQLFLYRCQNLGLDPLKPGQIYFIKYGNSPGTIVVGIEGFRSRAARTGKLAGIKRGAIRNDKGALVGAYAEVYRSDWKECAREEVPLAEYSTGKAMWAKMPETMIKKVAEAAALRMAFPDDLGGIYTNEEMDQAAYEQERKGFVEEGNGVQKEGYVFPGHIEKLKCKHIDDVSTGELRNFVEAVDKKYEKSIIPRVTKEARDAAHDEVLRREGVHVPGDFPDIQD